MVAVACVECLGWGVCSRQFGMQPGTQFGMHKVGGERRGTKPGFGQAIVESQDIPAAGSDGKSWSVTTGEKPRQQIGTALRTCLCVRCLPGWNNTITHVQQNLLCGACEINNSRPEGVGPSYSQVAGPSHDVTGHMCNRSSVIHATQTL